MRSLKSGLFGCVVAGLVVSVAVVGCTASGEVGDLEPIMESEPTEGEDQGRTILPPSNPDVDDDDDELTSSKKDAGKDASSKDAAKDSGPKAPEPGDPCTTVDQKFKRSCGKCGTQEALCLADLTVSEYSACSNEIGLCIPGSTQACGNCGTQTCSNSCNWGTCQGQPANSCSPGSVDYTTAGCTTPQTYRERVCGETCTWGNYSATCGAPNNPLKLTISGTVNGTVSGNYNLTATKLGKRVTSCSSSPSTDANYPYEIVEVRNNTAKAAKVSLWLSGTPAIDTVMAVYPTNLPPQTDEQLKACSKVNDQCAASLCTSPWSGLTDVSIPAGEVILVRFGAYWHVNDPDDLTTGPVRLTVRTDALN